MFIARSLNVNLNICFCVTKTQLVISLSNIKMCSSVHLHFSAVTLEHRERGVFRSMSICQGLLPTGLFKILLCTCEH